MKNLFVIISLSIVLLVACKQTKPAPASTVAPERIVLRFELDTAGNITDAAIKKQLAELATSISKNADRVMIYSYTEKMNTPEEGVAVAKLQADAAKAFMYNTVHSRIFYNVGIDARGFENPIKVEDATSVFNRRIEIEYL